MLFYNWKYLHPTLSQYALANTYFDHVPIVLQVYKLRPINRFRYELL